MGKRSRRRQVLTRVIRGDLDLQAQQTWPLRQANKPQARRPQEANLAEPLLQPQPQSAIASQNLNPQRHHLIAGLDARGLHIELLEHQPVGMA